MTSVSNLNSVLANSAVASGTSLGASGSTTSNSGQQLTQADFLQLMTAQLQAQDPTNPMDNSQFASQLAQFSQLSATQDLDSTVQSLSSTITNGMQTSQVLSSANLVGRQVMAPANSVNYTGSSVAGGVNVTTAGDVQVSVKDADGNLVRVIDLGQQQAGLVPFTWDGTTNSGNTAPSGTYSLSANNAGSTSALSTYLAGNVTGVGYGGSSVGTYLQVTGVGGVPLAQVAQIN
ncbi:MAG: flagellar hook capping FlgD N-terminal domain-containing protein [Rhodanobacter sp.]